MTTPFHLSSFVMYILIEGLSVAVSFLKTYLKLSWIFGTEYDPSGNSNSSFHAGADILNLLSLDDFFMFYHV